ncbi:MAG: MotA/TolQ/ExbB proton channel family protein [Luteolibacter sp.]
MTHQPAISFSNSFHLLFNRAGGRTSNVLQEMKTSPYAPSSREISIDRPAKAKWSGLLAGLGVALFTGPLWGCLWTVMSFIRAYNAIEESNPVPRQALANDIHIAFAATMIGVLVGLIGAALILTTLFATKFRAPWFYRNSIVLGIIWCIVIFPYGLFVGLPVVGSFIFRRTEFQKQEAEQAMDGNPH